MSIILSPRHGVNPSVEVCPLCYEDTGSLLLLGKLKGDRAAPRRVAAQDPCDKCKGHMTRGVILFSVRDNDKGYRTGGFVVMKDEAVRRIFNAIPEGRCAAVADSAWDMIGLPR